MQPQKITPVTVPKMEELWLLREKRKTFFKGFGQKMEAAHRDIQNTQNSRLR
jgi:hypothetical protein